RQSKPIFEQPKKRKEGPNLKNNSSLGSLFERWVRACFSFNPTFGDLQVWVQIVFKDDTTRRTRDLFSICTLSRTTQMRRSTLSAISLSGCCT
ncbi:unnamed protein product, partial [Nesidiocoris tenuis]